ncbi:MAG: glycerol-3-phosphate dehydrogenase/oxidase [Planctomycetes bacterium]|nr:glycerol-3-phosphate dehydrogenase/oxidase [Planctomycetota bacterium]
MQRHIEAFTDEVFDLCIVGGGITGAGVALDAATRGLRVALIERGDFASGSSTASSKLIHGGLRYLEHGHFSLVHEALAERARLLRNARHLVHPLPFVVPFYDDQRVAPWQWRLGLTVYDLLAGRDNIARSRPLSAREVTAAVGPMRPGLRGGALYHDAYMDDARLCLAVLRTAAGHGASLANYMEAVGFEKHAGAIAGVWALDRLTDRRFLVRARAVLNAGGAGADAIGALAGESREPHLQPTKGVHLIAPARGHRAACLLLHPDDGRVFFVIPWFNKTLLGTTDTVPIPGPDSLRVQDDEIAYLLDGYNHYFDWPLGSEHVLGAFAGLRPLVRSRPGEPSSQSREFRLHVGCAGLVTALGGKYTTFRQMAETITDFLGSRLGRSRRCRTRTLPLAGSPSMLWPEFYQRTSAWLAQHGALPPDSAAHLVTRYGIEVEAVLEKLRATPDGLDRLHPEEPDLLGEQQWQRDEEMAIFRDDFLLRRTRIGMWRPELALRTPTGWMRSA